jgi:hypothetical protein
VLGQAFNTSDDNESDHDIIQDDNDNNNQNNYSKKNNNDNTDNNDDDNDDKDMVGYILDISEICCDVLVTMIENINEIGSVLCLYNISCRTYGLKVLTEKKIHLKILKFLSFSMDLDTNCAYLRLLVQMCTCAECVSELYEHELIDILNKVLDRTEKINIKNINNEINDKIEDDNDENFKHNDEYMNRNKNIELLNSDISRCLIAVVRTQKNLEEKSGVVLTVIINRIIPDIESERTDENENIVTNCSIVIAYLSRNNLDFKNVDKSMKTICKRYRDNVVQKSVAIILFNISCTIEKKLNENENENNLTNKNENENESENFVNENITIENVKMILIDDSYLNIMIQVVFYFILIHLNVYVVCSNL